MIMMMMLFADMSSLRSLQGWLKKNIMRKEELNQSMNPVKCLFKNIWFLIPMKKCSGRNSETQNFRLLKSMIWSRLIYRESNCFILNSQPTANFLRSSCKKMIFWICNKLHLVWIKNYSRSLDWILNKYFKAKKKMQF